MSRITNFAYWSMRSVLAGVFIACFTAVALVMIGMALWLIITPIVPPDDPLWLDFRCKMGLASETDQKC